jgi:hypothetical protein
MLDGDMKLEDPARGAPSAMPRRPLAARREAVWHRISVESGYLRTELFNRQTVDETRKFLEAVLAAAIEHRQPLVLIRVRNSIPIFTLERYGLSEYLDLAFKAKYRIALVGDTVELRIAHQYVATVARMRGVKLRAFADESAAIGWLRAGDAGMAPAPNP